MKRGFILLLVLALLPVLPAMADSTEFESLYGFTLWYDGDRYLTGEAEDGAELLLPADPSVRALLRCHASMAVGQDWTADDPLWTPLEDDFDLAIRHGCYSTRSQDGTTAEQCLYVCGVDGFYLFSVQYDPAEGADAAAELWDVLHTVEFPPQPAQAGSFRLDFFHGGAAGMRFTDVPVDDGAETPVTLRLTAPVTQFVLERLAWDEEAFTIAQTEAIYAAPRLGPGDNLNLYCFFPDVLPALRIRCLNERGEAECWYLFQSGRDGSLLLLSEEEALPAEDG